jgi:hypothetical protein
MKLVPSHWNMIFTPTEKISYFVEMDDLNNLLMFQNELDTFGE